VAGPNYSLQPTPTRHSKLRKVFGQRGRVGAAELCPLDGMTNSKQKIQEQIRAIEGILRVWDPIGVIEDLEADDLPPNEYDDYAPHVLGLLQRNAGLKEMTGHLEYCRTTAMGLPANRIADEEIADRLVNWWQAESNHEADAV